MVPSSISHHVDKKGEEVMLRSQLIATVVATGVVGFSSTYACAEEFFARLIGVNENPSILSDGSGRFRLDLDRKANTATYELTFSGLSAPATQGHIHFSKARVNGGIIVWLCQSATNPSPVASTPMCPPNGGTVTGTITADSIVAVTAQLVGAGDFDALTDALASNSAYANVHSTLAPGGEIRGQIRERDRDEE
jgi:CHRD domain-containing protein